MFKANTLTKEMYGNMTKEEVDLVYSHKGNYKGWECIETGCGLVVMQKNSKQVRAYRGFEVTNWIPECWFELKKNIDELETN